MQKDNVKPGIFMMDDTQDSKAMLSSASQAGEEWMEVELTADTAACDTVVPRTVCENIPTTPALQSLRVMKDEVADGNEIPNPGERDV